MLDIWEVGGKIFVIGTMRKMSLEERLVSMKKCLDKGYEAQAEIFLNTLLDEVREADTDEKKLFIFNGETKE